MMRAPRWLQQLRLRPRLLLALALGLLVGLACPSHWSLSARLLCGWNAGVWFYLLAVLQMMLAADHEHVQRKSVAQADGVAAVLLLAAAGALASLAARVLVQEHRMYPQAVRWFVEGQLRRVDGRVEQLSGASQSFS